MDDNRGYYLVRDGLIDQYYVVGKTTFHYARQEASLSRIKRIKEGRDYMGMVAEASRLNKLNRRINI